MRSGTYGLLALFALVMIALSITPFSWAGWIYEDCGTRNCYCEPFRGGYFVRQPWTASSNYGYIVAGVLVLRSATGRNSQTSQRTTNARTGSPKWYGISLLLAGCFSFFSHASLTRVGEWFDLMGVYLLAGTMLGLSLRNIIGYAQFSDGILAAILAAGAAQMAFAPDLQMLVIASLLISITAVEIWTRARRKQHGPNRFLLAGAALFALGVLVWSIADQQGGCLWGGISGAYRLACALSGRSRGDVPVLFPASTWQRGGCRAGNCARLATTLSGRMGRRLPGAAPHPHEGIYWVDKPSVLIRPASSCCRSSSVSRAVGCIST